MRYTVDEIKELVKKCDHFIEIFRSYRDDHPCIPRHKDLIYFLVKRASYIKILEKKTLIH
jgi:hypothetical protein